MADSQHSKASAKSLPGAHIIIAGGTSVNEKYDHDLFPRNFLDAAWSRAKSFDDGGRIVLYMFTPSYKARVRDQKKEHELVVGCPRWKLWLDLCRAPNTKAAFLDEEGNKNEDYFWDLMMERAKNDGFEVIAFETADELTAKLANFPDRIASVEYFGHSNRSDFLLDYGIDSRPNAKYHWGKTQAAKISAGRFVNSAYFASYGCYQGEADGLASAIQKLWYIEAIGSVGKTDYLPIGKGETYPDSKGYYVQYATPSSEKGGDVYPPAVRITKAQLK
jgi:hypothetical protein